MAAVRKLFSLLPHVKGVFVAFLKCALVTWQCFSTEFAKDGVIASSSPSQRDDAWMPATNDANKGALGMYRIDNQQFPVESMHMYNAREMHKRNNMRRVLVASRKESAKSKREKQALQAAKKVAGLLQLQAVAQRVVLEEADILKMKADPIRLQLKYLRSLNGDDKIPKASAIKNKSQSIPALVEAMKRWHARHPEARAAVTQMPAERTGDLEALGEPSTDCSLLPGPVRSNFEGSSLPDSLEDPEVKFTDFEDENNSMNNALDEDV
ncbi:hypothetical protein SCHPADRAFT_895608 [Schizopora paradoxa]|uniref:Uncharacterized protein n=1 Tax=Schizopora paradoxa TaxID=27342 RepID=A0A0H2R389_9AGAM|nr:hypothetical protein SCHPADRAFT_895608 [Schizopora paradoxa]